MDDYNLWYMTKLKEIKILDFNLAYMQNMSSKTKFNTNYLFQVCKNGFRTLFCWIFKMNIKSKPTPKKITFDNVLKNLTQYHYHMEEMQKCGMSTCTWNHNILIQLFFFASYKMKSNH
jgi:hypothetical protein